MYNRKCNIHDSKQHTNALRHNNVNNVCPHLVCGVTVTSTYRINLLITLTIQYTFTFILNDNKLSPSLLVIVLNLVI